MRIHDFVRGSNIADKISRNDGQNLPNSDEMLGGKNKVL